MSDLSGSERRKLEKLLGMGGGYVLNFSDRTFGDFFDEYRVEIDAERYKARGTSKANRMRTFWDVDGNHVVGRVIGGLIEYATDEQCFGDSNPLLIDDCRKIAQRLLSDQPVAELDAGRGEDGSQPAGEERPAPVLWFRHARVLSNLNWIA